MSEVTKTIYQVYGASWQAIQNILRVDKKSVVLWNLCCITFKRRYPEHWFHGKNTQAKFKLVINKAQLSILLQCKTYSRMNNWKYFS